MNDFETVEARIRNAITPTYSLVQILKDIYDGDENSETLKEYLLNNVDVNMLLNSIEYIISIGHEVDKALPQGYSINDHLNKYYNKK